MPLKTVAILEDDLVTREMLRLLLEREGFSVLCPDGSEAESSLQKEPDLALVDLSVPFLATAAGRFAFRELAFAREIPVAVISARSRGEVERVAKELRASAWLAKPFSNDEVLRLVRGLIGDPVPSYS